MTGPLTIGASTSCNKIDNAETDGLEGTSDSLAYRVEEIEKHLHNWESWFAAAATPSGETHVADRIGPTDGGAFQIDAGDDTWGSWLQILGSSDTPARTSMVKFDLHKIQVEAVERSTATHYIQVAVGDSGAAGLAAGTYTELVFTPQGPQGEAVPIPILMPRRNAGSKVWIRIMVPGQNTGTMDFLIGLHEYIG